MRDARCWMALVGLAAVAAGCVQPPSTGPSYHVQAVTVDWGGSAWSDSPWPQANRPIDPPKSGQGAWGQRYAWRGPGEQPSWYGRHPHVPGEYVLVGQYYYPYYYEGGKVYPVYSMPYKAEGGRFVPYYTYPLPSFGPYVVNVDGVTIVKKQASPRQ